MIALDAYATATRLAPGDASILGNLGLAWLEARQPARARETAERAVALDPDAWLGWAILARASAQLGDATRAGEATARARQLAPATASGLLSELLP
jgi:Tfp pilus assembly protein PilF